MDYAIEVFVTYMRNVMKKSENTIASYASDLSKLKKYLAKQGITEVSEVKKSDLTDFIRSLEEKNFKAATICRNIASIKALFHYLEKEKMISQDISEDLQAPKLEKRTPGIISMEQVSRLLAQPSGNTPKEIRDKAMLELMYATGIRVTELATLQLGDINLRTGHIVCRDGSKERKIPFGQKAKKALMNYLNNARAVLIREEGEKYVFVNCSGSPMSRQGFWKLIKEYAGRAGIEEEITPQTLRHSFAAHLVENGADLKSVQEMMGFSAISSTQIYATQKQNNLRGVYAKAHPRA